MSCFFSFSQCLYPVSDFGLAEVPLVDLRPNGAPVRYYAVEASWKFPLNSTCKLLQVASCKWCWSYHNIDLIIIYYINWIIYIILIKVMYYEYTTYSIYIDTDMYTSCVILHILRQRPCEWQDNDWSWQRLWSLSLTQAQQARASVGLPISFLMCNFLWQKDLSLGWVV